MSDLKELRAKKESLEKKLAEIEKLCTEENENKILDAIKEQRWFFFKNKAKVLMDKKTGYLWANLDYFPYCKEGGEEYSSTEIDTIIKGYDFSGIEGFRVPNQYELCDMIKDKTFPFENGHTTRILGCIRWFVNNGNIECKDISNSRKNEPIPTKDSVTTSNLANFNNFKISKIVANLLPCSDIFVKNTSYANDIYENNKIFSDREKSKFTLDLFIKNELEPIFKHGYNDEGNTTSYNETECEEITKLYRKIYIEKKAIVEELKSTLEEFDKLISQSKISTDFNYEEFLEKYDVESIDKSIIKYYQAVQKWTTELIDKLDDYEKEKEEIIKDFNLISLKLSKEYEGSKSLTAEENELLKKRQKYFEKKLSLGMNTTKKKLISVKEDADNIEYRLDEIDDGENPIRELGIIENETRASFTLLAENTAKIIKNALKKLEFFEENRSYVIKFIDIWEKWTEDYKVFKTTYKEDLKTTSEEDKIEEEIWCNWYKEWQNKRFIIENKIQPAIDRGLKAGTHPLDNKADVEDVMNSIIMMLNALEKYKKSIDKFYLEERKAIYQKYAFVQEGYLQEKFESEQMVYKYVSEFYDDIQKIIFSCKRTEDRIFILKWANDIIELQIDEVIEFISNKDLQKISKKILDELYDIKKKNYDEYISDAKAYGEAKSKRDKEYNSLMFKMRKEISK